MSNKKSMYALILLYSILSACTHTPVSNSLPRSNPEAEGVSSQGVIEFLDSAAKSKHEFHSMMILRHGKVIAEGWWNPYRSDLKHTLYSTSKSFTSTAIGFAVSEKKISLEDKVISFFPEDKPDTISSYLSELKIKDLITMSVGQAPDPTFQVVSKDSNWIRSFLALPIVNKPGTKFLYNTLATYMLSAIVQKVTGEKVIDYLTPRLFKPLGIEGEDWEVDAQGRNTGGWGLRVKTEDMAKFGLLYLQKGVWNGKQVLPKEWVEEATSAKIDQAPDMTKAKKDSSDWTQGYCYQFWRCRHNAFRADGAYGQFIIVMPDKDAVIAITAESPDMQDEINLVWKYLFPSINDNKLPANDQAATQLKQKLESLALPTPERSVKSSMVGQISGKSFSLEANDRHFENIGLQFKDDVCSLKLKTNAATYELSFGPGKWQLGETTKYGPSLVNRSIAKYEGIQAFKIAGCYDWKDENTLELVLRYIESPHTETFICTFDKNKVSVDIRYSNYPGMKTPSLIGTMME
jgi:CubicO group peptidase (beta-lactamase class C family)